MTKRKPIAAGNWKMNKGIQETEHFIQELLRENLDQAACEIIIAPPFPSLANAVKQKSGSIIQIAGQNCHQEDAGAYTGEVSAAFLKDAGCSHVILGHSERRAYFHESNELIRAKIAASWKQSLIPIYCVGETLSERENGQVEQVLRAQIQEALQSLAVKTENLVVAYEPVWAIGTGKVASAQDAQSAHRFIRELLEQMFGKEIAQGIRILYGGSAKPDNIAELIAQPDIDGGLIGGASLKADSFWEMIRQIA